MVTCTPSASARSYSARGAKFGVNRMRSGEMPGTAFEHVLDLGQRHAIEPDALRRDACAGSPDADWP